MVLANFRVGYPTRLGHSESMQNFFPSSLPIWPSSLEVYVYPPAQWLTGSKDFLEKQGFKVKREIPEKYNSILLRHEL